MVAFAHAVPTTTRDGQLMEQMSTAQLLIIAFGIEFPYNCNWKSLKFLSVVAVERVDQM
jgi:hypothetical protein